MVPRVGVEPTLPKEQDFESSASANFAIWAQVIFLKKAPNHAKARFPYKVLNRLYYTMSSICYFPDDNAN